MTKVIDVLNSVATFSSAPEDGGNSIAYTLRELFEGVVGLGYIAYGIQGLIGQIKP